MPLDFIKTDLPGYERVVITCTVTDFGAQGDGRTDDTEAFRKALDHAASLGGGTVYAPAGQYRINDSLYLAPNVYLLGQWSHPDRSPEKIADGTVLLASMETAGPLIGLAAGSGLIGVTVYYPDQSVEHPQPCPATIKAMDGISPPGQDRATSGFAVLKYVTLVNPWTGVLYGPDWNECHVAEYLFMTPLKLGVFVNMVTDIGRLTELHIGARYWAAYTGGDAASIAAALRINKSVGLHLQRADWQYVFNSSIDDVDTAVLFDKMEGDDATLASNGQFYDFSCTGVRVGLDLMHVNTLGIAFTRLHMDTPDGVCIQGRPTYNGAIMIRDFTLSAPETCILLERGSTGMLSLEAGSMAAGRTGVDASGSSLTLSACKGPAGCPALTIRDAQCVVCVDAVDALSIDNPCGAAIVESGPCRETRIDEAVPAFRTHTRRGDRYTSLEPDGTGDRSGDIQRAIDDMAGQGGGIVYLPAGTYTLEQPLTIHPLVTLCGVSQAGHHTNSLGTVLYARYGEGHEDGPALIELEDDAVLSGLTVWYPGQRTDSPVMYPWTVRASGRRTAVTNVNVAGAWKAFDFGTHDCSGLYAEYLTGTAVKCNVYFDHITDGAYVRNCHFNPHFSARTSGSGLADDKGAISHDIMEAIALLDRELTAVVIGTVTGLELYDIFNYRSQVGLHTLPGSRLEDVKLFAIGQDGTIGGLLLEHTGKAVLINSNVDAVPSPACAEWLESGGTGVPPADIPPTYYAVVGPQAEAAFIGSSFGAFNYIPQNGFICNGNLKLYGCHLRASAVYGALLNRGRLDAGGCLFSHVGRIVSGGFVDQKPEEAVDTVDETEELTLNGCLFRVFDNHLPAKDEKATHSGNGVTPYAGIFRK